MLQKIVAFKTGTYSVHGATATSDCSINTGVKPRSYLGIESGVVLSMANGHFYANTGDLAFINLELRGCRTDLDNNRIIQVPARANNCLFWKLLFSEQSPGANPIDNPCCIMFWDDDSFSRNIAVVDCVAASTVTQQLIVTFACEGVLIENNSMLDLHFDTGHNGSVFIHVKDDTTNVTVRFNRTTGSCENAMIRMSNQQSDDPELLSANQEVCYNFVKSSTVDFEGGPILWNQNATGKPNAANTHCYRNTVLSPSYALRAPSWLGGDAVEVSGMAYTATLGIAMVSDGWIEILPANVQVAGSDLDSNGYLTNATGKRTAHLGKVGFEIATDAF